MFRFQQSETKNDIPIESSVRGVAENKRAAESQASEQNVSEGRCI